MAPESGQATALESGLARLPGAGLDPGQRSQLLGFLEILQRWNRSYNLTAVRDPVEMVSRHLLDSLSVLPWVSGSRLLDAGTGAGLPGVPLAIARQELEVVLLDSAGKKIRFLNQVVRELQLPNAHPVQSRLEAYGPDAGFDVIISRAFSSLAAFAGAARHLAGGARLLAMKGRYPAAELDDLPGWVRVQSVEKLSVPGLQEDRHLVIMSVNP
ncbi:MAG TPA: 16S rRNA (guanine(527)-N(7))-methyltransferase RsmG [Xanthomonadales bacterium]|nr:16S rRNA (guanine(527)-N(7))-methyltransferase RsmG [Xanthomonadales bacterium]